MCQYHHSPYLNRKTTLIYLYVRRKESMEMKGKKKEREICLASLEESSKCKPFFGSNLSEESSSKTSLYICFFLTNLLSIPKTKR
ncbi:hypothetical protein AtEden1_Chr1g0020711 [Arabidopsis thaliana]